MTFCSFLDMFEVAASQSTFNTHIFVSVCDNYGIMGVFLS